MFKKMIANPAIKKCLIFALVFAMTGVLMGSVLIGITDSEDAITFINTESLQSGGSYGDFVRMVRESNGLSTEDLELLIESPTAEKLNGQAGFVYLEDIALSKDLQEYTYNRCKELDLEYELILAVMWRESGFQTDAVGYNKNGTRDSGIMQINDINRGWLNEKYGITDLMDPYQNINAGTAILADYMAAYNETSALMAYHLGEAGMKSKLAQGITANSTVNKAFTFRDDFREMIKNAS